MSAEQKNPGIAITGIHLDLLGRSILLEASQKPIAKITFSNGTLYFNSPFLAPAEAPTAAPMELTAPESPASVQEPREEVKEKEQPVTLSGRLKSKPKE